MGRSSDCTLLSWQMITLFGTLIQQAVLLFQSTGNPEVKVLAHPLHPLLGGAQTFNFYPLRTPLLLGVYHRVVQHQGRVHVRAIMTITSWIL